MAVNLDMYRLLYELNTFSKDLISVLFYSEKLGQYITEANIYLKRIMEVRTAVFSNDFVR